MQNALIRIWCKTFAPQATPVWIAIHSPNAPHTPGLVYFTNHGDTYCPTGNFTEVDLQLAYATLQPLDLSGLTHGPNFEMAIYTTLGNTAFIAVSTIRVTFFVTGAVANCGTDFWTGIGCQIQQFFGLIVNGILFVANLLLFIGAVLFWFIGLVAIFFIALGSLFTGMGLPTILSGLMGVLIVGFLFFLALIFMGKVRGTGNVG